MNEGEPACLPHSVAAENALRIWWSLSQTWFAPPCYRAGYANVQRVLALREYASDPMQVKALLFEACVLRSGGEVERAETQLRDALAICRRTGDLPGAAFALQSLGEIAFGLDRYAAAGDFFEEAAGLASEGNGWDKATALLSLSSVLLVTGGYEEAQAAARQSLAIFRGLAAPQQAGEALARLGWSIFVGQGDLAASVPLVEEALAIAHEANRGGSAGRALFQLGAMRLHAGDLAEARAMLEQSLAGEAQPEPHDLLERRIALASVLALLGEWEAAHALYVESRELLSVPGCGYLAAEYLEAMGAQEAAQGAGASAARLWGAAEALREGLGAPIYPVDREEHARAMASARAQLGEAAFDAAWSQGRALSPEEALGA